MDVVMSAGGSGRVNNDSRRTASLVMEDDPEDETNLDEYGQTVLPTGACQPGQGGTESVLKCAVKRVRAEDDDDASATCTQTAANCGELPRKKKTRGRVKIEMEFIQNKLRRYTTFSKRKSGIMKKVCFPP